MRHLLAVFRFSLLILFIGGSGEIMCLYTAVCWAVVLMQGFCTSLLCGLVNLWVATLGHASALFLFISWKYRSFWSHNELHQYSAISWEVAYSVYCLIWGHRICLTTHLFYRWLEYLFVLAARYDWYETFWCRMLSDGLWNSYILRRGQILAVQWMPASC